LAFPLQNSWGRRSRRSRLLLLGERMSERGAGIRQVRTRALSKSNSGACPLRNVSVSPGACVHAIGAARDSAVCAVSRTLDQHRRPARTVASIRRSHAGCKRPMRVCDEVQALIELSPLLLVPAPALAGKRSRSLPLGGWMRLCSAPSAGLSNSDPVSPTSRQSAAR
jgi:hypothetical protein